MGNYVTVVNTKFTNDVVGTDVQNKTYGYNKRLISATNHAFQIGSSSGNNLRLDNNQIYQ